jgi:hypothetical protein
MMMKDTRIQRGLAAVLLAFALGLGGCGPGDENGNGENGNGQNGNGTGNGENGNGGNGNGELPEPGTLTGVEPATGSVAGGTAVEVTGTEFLAGLEIRFGDAPCTSLTIVSPTRAACFTPAASGAGPVDVVAYWPGDHEDRLIDGFEYHEGEEIDPVAYCHLQWPFTLQAEPNEADVGPIYGWVYHPEITDADDNGDAILAEIGVGPEGSIPGADWTWVSAPYHDRRPNPSEELVNYEYRGFVTAPEDEGAYDFAYRFRLAAGGPWTYCHSVDAGGSTAGYDPDHAGKLTVEAGEPADPDPIAYCHLQWPTELFATPGEEEVGPVFGWAYHPEVTDADGNEDAIEAELGVGPQGSDPRDGGDWTWTGGGFHERKGNDYEYAASFTAPLIVGTYHYAWRFRLGEEGPWTYCHSAEGGGSNHEDGYSADYAGVLEVAAVEPAQVDYCHLHYPFAVTVAPGAETGLIYGRVFHNGVTNPPNNEEAIEAEVGRGPEGSDPRVQGNDWTWYLATFNQQYGNDYEYEGTLSAPEETGVYDYAYRFRLASGGAWRYCHQGGELAPEEALGSNHPDGYHPDYAGKMTVEE